MKPVLLLVLLAPLYLSAQEDCKVRFGVIQDGKESAKEGWRMWPADATEWWTKSGKKDFKGICYALKAEEADWLILWTDHEVSRSAPASIYGRADSSGSRVQGHGEREWTEQVIQASLYKWDRRPIEDVKLENLPELSLFSRKQVQWALSKPGKDAFQELLKYISKAKPR